MRKLTDSSARRRRHLDVPIQFGVADREHARTEILMQGDLPDSALAARHVCVSAIGRTWLRIKVFLFKLWRSKEILLRLNRILNFLKVFLMP